MAVITASPGTRPVTTPLSFTVATSGLEEVQVTLRSVTVQGSTEADSVLVVPFSRVRDSSEI